MGTNYNVSSIDGETRAGTTTDNAIIGPNGTSFIGTGRYTRKIVLTPNLLTGGGLNAPSISVIGNVGLVLEYSNNIEEEMFAIWEANPVTDSTADIKWHILWSPSNTDTGDVIWAIEFNLIRPDSGDLITKATATSVVVDTASGTVNRLQSTGEITIVAPGGQPGDLVQLRIYRDATNITDTYTGDAQFSVVTLLVVADKLGGTV